MVDTQFWACIGAFSCLSCAILGIWVYIISPLLLHHPMLYSTSFSTEIWILYCKNFTALGAHSTRVKVWILQNIHPWRIPMMYFIVCKRSWPKNNDLGVKIQQGYKTKNICHGMGLWRLNWNHSGTYIIGLRVYGYSAPTPAPILVQRIIVSNITYYRDTVVFLEHADEQQNSNKVLSSVQAGKPTEIVSLTSSFLSVHYSSVVELEILGWWRDSVHKLVRTFTIIYCTNKYDLLHNRWQEASLLNVHYLLITKTMKKFKLATGACQKCWQAWLSRWSEFS